MGCTESDVRRNSTCPLALLAHSTPRLHVPDPAITTTSLGAAHDEPIVAVRASETLDRQQRLDSQSAHVESSSVAVVGTHLLSGGAVMALSWSGVCSACLVGDVKEAAAAASGARICTPALPHSAAVVRAPAPPPLPPPSAAAASADTWNALSRICSHGTSTPQPPRGGGGARPEAPYVTAPALRYRSRSRREAVLGGGVMRSHTGTVAPAAVSAGFRLSLSQ